MKGQFACIVAAIGLLFPTLSQGKNLVFGVKPSLGVQSSYLGLQTGSFTPYFGLDILNIGVKVKSNDEDWEEDWNTGVFYKYHEGWSDISGSATLLIPHFGMKFHLADKGKKVRPYLLGDFFKSFAFVNVKGTSTDRYYDPGGTLYAEYTDSYDLEKNEEKFIESLLGVWGFIAAFGAEYSFSDHFSVCGEYGLRLFFTSAENNDHDSGDWDNDGVDDWRSKWNSELSATLKMSYAAIGLNFKF